jgi:hypothetical protein
VCALVTNNLERSKFYRTPASADGSVPSVLGAMPAKGTRKSKDKERKKEVSPTSTVNTRSRDKKDSADVAHALALSQKDHLQQQEMQEEEDRTLS